MPRNNLATVWDSSRITLYLSIPPAVCLAAEVRPSLSLSQAGSDGACLGETMRWNAARGASSAGPSHADDVIAALQRLCQSQQRSVQCWVVEVSPRQDSGKTAGIQRKPHRRMPGNPIGAGRPPRPPLLFRRISFPIRRTKSGVGSLNGARGTGSRAIGSRAAELGAGGSGVAA